MTQTKLASLFEASAWYHALTLDERAALLDVPSADEQPPFDVERAERSTGVPFNVETPGLMTGLAGIGYGLLRLADPQNVPSVLLLELPLGIPQSIAQEELSEACV